MIYHHLLIYIKSLRNITSKSRAQTCSVIGSMVAFGEVLIVSHGHRATKGVKRQGGISTDGQYKGGGCDWVGTQVSNQKLEPGGKGQVDALMADVRHGHAMLT